MKIRLLIIFAILIVLFPLVPLIQFNLGHQVMVDGFTISGSIVWLISIVFSTFSWFLFAWASKSIKVEWIPLSIISGAFLIIPFHDVLGPMASIIVGLVAGFVAFMFQKYLTTKNNKYLKITIATLAASFVALTILIVLLTFSSVWDGNGIGTWSGTAEGMERHVQIFGFSFNIDNMSTGNPNECYYRSPDGTLSV
jgi:hypothetical protein